MCTLHTSVQSWIEISDKWEWYRERLRRMMLARHFSHYVWAVHVHDMLHRSADVRTRPATLTSALFPWQSLPLAVSSLGSLFPRQPWSVLGCNTCIHMYCASTCIVHPHVVRLPWSVLGCSVLLYTGLCSSALLLPLLSSHNPRSFPDPPLFLHLPRFTHPSIPRPAFEPCEDRYAFGLGCESTSCAARTRGSSGS